MAFSPACNLSGIESLICGCNINGRSVCYVFSIAVSAHFSFDELALTEGKHQIKSRYLAKFQTGLM